MLRLAGQAPFRFRPLSSNVRRHREAMVFDEAYLEYTLHHAFSDPNTFRIPRGIIRFDYGTTHAWRVNVARDKAKFVEYFYDGQAGSIENGLRLAILYRHEILEAFPVTITLQHGRMLDPEPEKRIQRVTEPGRLNPYVFWRATWHDAEYKRCTKNFSVTKYGDDEARKMALEAARVNHNPIPKNRLVPDMYVSEKWRAVSRAEIEQAAATNDYEYGRHHSWPEVAESYPFGFEGERRAKLHIAIERDRSLRNGKVAAFLKRNGRLFCELCGFSFKDTYSFLAKDIIEVHHKLPLASLASSTRISAEDLILLCSNCHTAIHQGDAVENLRAASLLYQATTATLSGDA